MLACNMLIKGVWGDELGGLNRVLALEHRSLLLFAVEGLRKKPFFF